MAAESRGLRLALVGGGAPVAWAICSTRSRTLPSLTVAYSGFTINKIRSKYSLPVSLTSTTWTADTLYHGASSLVPILFCSYFGQSAESLYGRGWKKNWQLLLYTTCIVESLCKSVENSVESVDNRAVFLENKVGSTKNAECGERLLTIYHIQWVLSALRNAVLSAKLGISPAEEKTTPGGNPAPLLIWRETGEKLLPDVGSLKH
ncbi:MAG: hypothetical protein ACLTQL_11555 [Eisenbergiella sp.]